MMTLPVTTLVAALGLALAAGCGQNPRYCDESTECGDPSYVCDLGGVCPESEGLTNSCIPPSAICWDAGGPPSPDAAAADAAEYDADPEAPDAGIDDAAVGPDGFMCTPDEFLRCDGADEITCHSSGTSEVSTPCTYGCNAGAGRCNECTPSSTVCSGSTLTTCSAGGLVSNQSTCALGCHPGGTRCYDLDPSNGLALYLDQTSTAPVITLTDGATIDTDTGAVVNGDSSSVTIPSQLLGAPAMGVAVRVLMVKSITLNDVTVNGTAALAIVADGKIEVRGTLELAGALGPASSGPGYYPSCNTPNGTLSGSFASGSGGGGFGTMGGAGGDAVGVSGGSGGGISGNAQLVPLRGGCGGGPVLGGSGAGAPGAGGGAVQLASRTEISVVLGSDGGQITVAGGGGNAEGDAAGLRGGTGGGSGGAILLEAPTVSVANGAGLTANGGGGGCFGAAPAGPGTLSLSPTPGANCNSTSYGDGGTGGALSSPAGGSGEDITGGTTAVGGGGGGGMGRIRVNTATGAFTPAGSAIISPTPSVGTAGKR